MSIKDVPKTPTTDLHSGDGKIESQLSPQTITALSQMSPDELRSTSTALDNIAQTLQNNLDGQANKKNSITTNLIDLTDEIAVVSDPQSALINSSVSTVSDGMRSVKGADKQEVLAAGSLARETTPDAHAIRRFEERKAALVSGKISKRMTDMIKAIAIVNAMKSAIDKKLE